MCAKILYLSSSKGAAAHRSVLHTDKNAINECLNNPPRGENMVRLNVKWDRGTKGHA